jgi:hypothetical protein
LFDGFVSVAISMAYGNIYDTTLQEKNITYPTDAKLAIKIINRLNKLAKRHGIQQRRSLRRALPLHQHSLGRIPLV